MYYRESLKFVNTFSDSVRHRSQNIFQHISQIVLENFIKISLLVLIKKCPELCNYFDKTSNCPEDAKV